MSKERKNRMARILAIDDESGILNVIKKGLEKDGHEVTVYESVVNMDMKLIKHFDLLLLDIMMPDMDGFEFCKVIRSEVDFPIVFLTAKALENDITHGLEIGADDYLIKPFRIAELRARVNAHLRREQRERQHTLPFDGYEFNLDAKSLCVNGIELALTRSEYLICEFLARNKQQVFSREQIYEAVFDIYGESDNSTICTHIKNIRLKLSEQGIDPIKTVWGIGYKWQ